MLKFLQNSLRKHFAIPRIAAFLFVLMTCSVAMAQEFQVSGKVTSGEDQSPLPGVNILVKGTTSGTISDANGAFIINVGSGNDVLVFSFVGFTSQEVPIGGRTSFDVTLASDAKQLSEIVVTALGVEKEKKSLGYAIQSVGAESLTTARETNISNQLAGKIAGVTVIGSNSGVGGSSRVTIRGERSLNLNANQPLYVIDGVPISNGITGASGRSNLEVDFGNGASFVNSDDIESMTVLKGAAASALYGSRAANGVIVIKTKSGKGTKGIGVEINSNTTFESALRLPDYQNVYGQGNGNGGDFAFVNGGGAGLTDGTDESWGPAFNGQLYPQFNSPRTLNGSPIAFRGGDLNAPAGSVITPTLWQNDKDGVKNFFQTGKTYTNNVALVGSNQNGDFRLSYTGLDQTGIVPNTDLRRNTVSFGGGYNLSKKFSARAFVSYIKSESDNRPSISYGTENIMYLFNCWLPRSVDMESLRNYWMPGLEGRRQSGWNYNYHDNPYFTVYENTNGQNVDRIIGNISLKYEFTPWLNLQLRTALDYGNERRQYRRAFSTQRFPFGQYREANIVTEERNTDFLLTFNKEIIPSVFTLTASLGGNQLRQKSEFLEINAPQLNIPGVYNLTNFRAALQSSQTDVKKSINSLYGSAQLGYKNILYLDLTARNDWSSALTLPQALKDAGIGTQNNSYFYSSAALSAVISDMVQLPKFISFAKVRASAAQVGNDTDAFTFTQSFNPSDPFGTTQVYGETDRLANFSLKPEISTSYEGGFDVRFFGDRLGLDFTYYQTLTKNQILNIPLSNTSGYNARSINAGEIKNYGFEVMVNSIPVRLSNGFQWNLDVNFSSNRSEVVSLSDGLTNYVLATRRVSIEARVGERMGDMYGIGFARVQNTDPTKPYYDASGQFVGQQVFTNPNAQGQGGGRPIATTARIKLGNYNPDWMAGINNTFTFKGVKLGVLFDIRQGGQVYSETQTVGREGGIIMETLEGRENGYYPQALATADPRLLNAPVGTYVVGNGVNLNSDGTFKVNDNRILPRQWHSAYTGGRNIAEGVVYDASFVKLRELQIGYTIPNKIFSKTPFRSVTISLVGRNLALWTDVPHIDPEVMSYTGGTALPGIENMSIPSSRSYGFNVGLKF
ncbi:MAG: SusC/RagA family TonB-linked outer membrane protein [Cytophagales bacterium]|jgi:TonB-linked SusC/RagA family outer membrane protein|nr:SusC/RagA family TonB-linked outer membrane protein [Cytophagales bacterium]MCA6387409.1 SusC/RagA family TonB-linked outer membrane protein [Cytophagales bacterium]MCA6390194.1 SusC/RagA family TonB-linked outer membrane protein [Cytophagales bacterium]MCA6397896.1 SusC/RagA family TonB-linked outer membrane protein [Cytophagales bacterium]MCA6401819.1 SusC/RagA family TonB-linked outer membrane protein [Cytophagales bacterium]